MREGFRHQTALTRRKSYIAEYLPTGAKYFFNCHCPRKAIENAVVAFNQRKGHIRLSCEGETKMYNLVSKRMN